MITLDHTLKERINGVIWQGNRYTIGGNVDDHYVVSDIGTTVEIVPSEGFGRSRNDDFECAVVTIYVADTRVNSHQNEHLYMTIPLDLCALTFELSERKP